MRYFSLIVLSLMLAGCDREITPGTGENDPSNAGGAQVAPPEKSDTLKIRYSKSDPLEPVKSATQKDGASETHAHDHADHGEMKKPDEKKPGHQEHEAK